MRNLPPIFRSLLLGAVLGSLPLAYAWSSGIHNDFLNIIVLLFLLALGLPWNLGIFFALISSGQDFVVWVNLPFLGNTVGGWEIFGKAIFISLSAGACINGFIIGWLRYSLPGFLAKRPVNADADA
jgi:hypothetical protein